MTALRINVHCTCYIDLTESCSMHITKDISLQIIFRFFKWWLLNLAPLRIRHNYTNIFFPQRQGSASWIKLLNLNWFFWMCTYFFIYVSHALTYFSWEVHLHLSSRHALNFLVVAAMIAAAPPPANKLGGSVSLAVCIDNYVIRMYWSDHAAVDFISWCPMHHLVEISRDKPTCCTIIIFIIIGVTEIHFCRRTNSY